MNWTDLKKKKKNSMIICNIEDYLIWLKNYALRFKNILFISSIQVTLKMIDR